MQFSRLRILATAFALVLCTSSLTMAQGVTTAAISGRVTERDGAPVANAQIQVRNRATGVSSGALSDENGRYLVQGLEVGGGYVVTVRRIGFGPATRENVSLNLGQRLQLDFALDRQAVELTGVTVTSAVDPTFSATKMGVGTVVSDSSLRRLPTLNRNFTDFVSLSPQVSTSGPGQSGGGVNNRFNNIQIDGASENDLFGLGASGQPGGQARGKSISIESVKEYQVLLSPYDVRQGNFAGALINAVTKSGTNQLTGSAYYFTRNEKLARDVDFIRNSTYDHTQYGFSIGGPIVKDRIHFFLNPEFQQREQPAAGPYLGQAEGSQTPVPVRQAEIDRFRAITDSMGLPSGSAGLINNTNPLVNLFVRIDAQLPYNSRLVLRHNYGSAEDDNFGRSTAVSNPIFALSSTSYYFQSKKNAPVAQLFTNFRNGSFNELIVGYNNIRDSRTPSVRSPLILVNNVKNALDTTRTSRIQAGSEQFSQGNELDQDLFELQNNYTFTVRGAHNVTVGGKLESFKFRNLFTESSYGVYTFRNLDSLARGVPETYRVSGPLGPPGSEVARLRGTSYGVYVQDQWQARQNVNLTFGLRADVPTFDNQPLYTPFVDSVFNRRTDEIPTGNVQISPRFGFNWNIDPVRRTQLRGGVGVYVGRPAYVWLANSFQNSGSGLGILNCGGTRDPGRVPTFSPDAFNQPLACPNRTAGQPDVALGIGGVLGPVNLLDKDLQFPQTLRGSIGFDRQVGSGIVLTLEGLFTRGLNNFFYINRNLGPATGLDRNGRVVYGTIATNGQSTAPIVDASRRLSEVIDVTNQSKDYSYNLTGLLEKRFANSFEARASYTFSRSRDVQSLTSSRAISNWRFGRTLSGNHDDQNRGISLFDQPHRVVVSGSYAVKRTLTDISLFYNGQSGSPYDYIYGQGSSFGTGDLNADGNTGNDLVYVPRNTGDPNEIRFAGGPTGTGLDSASRILAQSNALERFIQGTECLREQRGSIIKRNSCREPWQNRANMSLRQSLPAVRGQRVSLQMDVFNVLNLINKEWGQVRSVGGFSNVTLLTHQGQTAGTAAVGTNGTSSQGIFQFNPDFRRTNSRNLDSNYQIQLSARYSF